ncbi:CcdB family protein [Sphingomonas japonica]|uniref:Toxin CcdB n=1 Tax=Sphingomonas japonica TaxID=511662 RepID=A0ABX0TXJ4_9SPHN|nr:CcdB family protein [Sphingomonas japonica]NIJ23018.1 toxin CcdB [Sphingomonas japonica]
MARFDVYRLGDGALVLDCQADFLDDIATRFVVPLVPPGEGPPPNPRLNPRFDIGEEPVVMVTQFATSIRTSELRTKVGSLDHAHIEIVGALDVLIGAG